MLGIWIGLGFRDLGGRLGGCVRIGVGLWVQIDVLV